MKRVLAKIGRFFWSWGFLKFVLWVITIIVLFYVEEDWRGAQAWSAMKEKWEAKGESFDMKKFVPPVVPDAQNMVGIPAYKLEKVTGSRGQTYLDDVAMRKALENFSDKEFSNHPNWRKGESPAMEKIRQEIAMKYAEVFKNAPSANDPVAELDALFPFVSELRNAANLPKCELPYDDTQQMPAARALGLVTSQIKVSKLLNLYALLELENHRPDLALDYLRIDFRLADAVQHDSTLVAALVKMSMVALGTEAIYDGLSRHLWSDEQLAEIGKMLGAVDFLADYQWAMRNTAVESYVNIDVAKKYPPSEIIVLMTGMSEPPLLARGGAYIRLPLGWFDLAKCEIADDIFYYLDSVNPAAHRAYPEVAQRLEDAYELRRREGSYLPWDWVRDVMLGPLVSTLTKFAQAQVWVDETRIACALERYRLVHGVYPGSLEALVPAAIEKLPRDVMNGEPYRYRLLPNGSFLLYSVGANQKDDGGAVVYEDAGLNRQSYHEGDWTWPTPQSEPAKTP